MLANDIIFFLKKVEPFRSLSDHIIREIADEVSVEEYPAGTVILKQNDPPSEFLRLIMKGNVSISLRNRAGDDVAIGYRGEGDNFGLWSIIDKGVQKTTVAAISNTACLLIPAAAVQTLLDTNAVFTEFFLKSHIKKYMDIPYDSVPGRDSFYGGADRILYSTRIAEIAIKDVVTIDIGSSIRDAARKMSISRVSSIVIVDNSRIPAGILTDADLRDKVIARGRSYDDPVDSVMSMPIVRADASDYCFEAVLKMTRHNVRHVLVIKEGELRGVMTLDDLVNLQASLPMSVLRDIEDQPAVEGLVPIAARINRIAGMLMREGAGAVMIMRIISELNDRLVNRIIEMAERKFGRPPVSYCWVTYGAEGRMEQAFRTDHSSGIIYSDPDSAEQEGEARQYFVDFAAFVEYSLIKCGFVRNPQNFTSSNVLWCQQISMWKQYFSGWIGTPNDESLSQYRIMFDIRPIRGDESLVQTLRHHILGLIRNSDDFLSLMAASISRRKLSGSFIRSLAAKGGLDLKASALTPLSDAARLLALALSLPEISTSDRIASVRTKDPAVAPQCNEMLQSFEFLANLHLRSLIDQFDQGRVPVDIINADKLGESDRNRIRESLQVVQRILAGILDHYRFRSIGV